MKKPVTKIICATLASVVALGITAAAGCSPYNKGKQLGGENIFTEGKAVSNGGFAVEKGDYVYFINGVTDNTVDNSFGTPDKGAVKRISKTDLKNRNYSSVDTVVRQIAYSGNNDAGIFVYGDYLYYSTPSTLRNSDGVIKNGELELKRTKLDGTESAREAFVTFPSVSYDFRFVESAAGEVYVLYVATDEKLFDESTGVTNLHSVNTATGTDTLLAYNISSYLFDAEDKTNPAVYYTMNVMSFATGSTEIYNQIYRVCADATVPNEYKTDGLTWWDDEENRYINCGKLALDGIGGPTVQKTPFNYDPADESLKNAQMYSYTLKNYVNGRLYYTRHTATNSAEYLYCLKDGDISGNYTAEINPVTLNPAQGEKYILADGAAASSYKYLFGNDGELEAVLCAESSGGISINRIKDGVLAEDIDNVNYYRIVRTGSATILHVDSQNGYVYYSVTGGTGYTFNRISYKGSWRDYDGMFENDDVGEYTPVKILDLDADSAWYFPEFIQGNILFASETDKMSSYNYIMVFSLEEDGKVITNARIDQLNGQFDGVIGDKGIISGYADADKYETAIYANLSGAAKYLFYTADKAYVDELAALCNAGVEEGADPVYSESTLEKLDRFLVPAGDNDWAAYSGFKRQVNGKEVYANRRDYYYSVLGVMTEEDAEGLLNSYRTEYLVSRPEEETPPSWWDSLGTVGRVFFIIGMCLAGVAVICGAVFAIEFAVRRKRRGKTAETGKRRIKVDTTDDKNIDVYGTDK